MSTSLTKFWEENVKKIRDQRGRLDLQHSEIAKGYGPVFVKSDVSRLKNRFLSMYASEINELYGKADISARLASAVPIGFSHYPVESDEFRSIIASHHSKVKEITFSEIIGNPEGGRVAISLPSGVDDYVWTPNEMGTEKINELKNDCVFTDTEGFFQENVSVPVQLDLIFYTHGKKPTVISYGDISNVPVIFHRVPGYKNYTGRQAEYDNLEDIDGEEFENRSSLEAVLKNKSSNLNGNKLNINCSGKIEIFNFEDLPEHRCLDFGPEDETIGFMSYVNK